MTQYLAARSSQRPSSATLQRRMQIATSKTKTFSQTSSKSVRFDESSSKSTDRNVPPSKSTNRNVPPKEKRFNFLRRKKKEEDGMARRIDGAFSPGVCDSPSSIRSAPSAVGHSVARGCRVHSPVLSLDGGDVRARSPASSDISGSHDNMYTLYAVCNHLGTMTRGHYTAYCRNPTDSQWYMFDDSHVQAIREDQLVTAGAYLLFYVRQSLGGLLGSSSSGSGTTHWAMNIPQFKLEMPLSSEDTPSPSNQNNNTSPRPRLGSTGSQLASVRGFSPPHSVTHDSENDVFGSSRVGVATESQSVASSILSNPTQSPHVRSSSLHHHQASPTPNHHLQAPDIHHRSLSVSSPKPQGQLRGVGGVATAGLGGRHASLRLGRQRQFSPDAMPVTNDQFYRRGTSFHGSRQPHEPVRRTVTDSGRLLHDMPVHPAYPGSGQVLSVPSRSIPNMSSSEQQDWRDQDTPLAVPSRSIPNIVKEVPTTPGQPSRHTHQPHPHYTPQPNRPRHASTRSYSIGPSNPGTESCV